MLGLPKIVLERLKGKPISNQLNRQSAIENRQFPHPDANLLATFAERTLTERERKEVLNHLAQCAECRDVLALALPREAEVAAPARSPVRWGWSLWPALRWGAVAAAVGVVAVVAILRFHQLTRRNAVSKELRSAVATNSSKTAQQLSAELSARGSLKVSAAKVGAESPQSPPEVARRRMHLAPPPAEPVSVQPTNAELKRLATLTVAARPPAPQGIVPARPESVTVTAGLSADMGARATAPLDALHAPLPPSSQNRGLMQGASAASLPTRSAPVVAKSQQARPAIMALRAALQSVAPQPAALWTVAPDGKPQRSDDGGKTWQDVHIDDKVAFRVIEATGRDVWAAGSAGALYHSSDGGAIWSRVNLSSGGSPTTEAIVSVVCSSSDPQRITVTSASGERWTSEDGGEHWRTLTSDE